MDTNSTDATTMLHRPGGAVAYDVGGTGPLVVCAPGMGELRATYRFLAPELVRRGFRVATTDLRGHGDSDASFADYGDEPTADDLAALIRELGGGAAVLIGNSMAAGASVLVAARHPELVRGLVLLGPFVRDPATSALTRFAFRAAMVPLWATTTWKAYLPKLYAGRKPEDFDVYRAAVVDALKRPGHAAAFSATTRTSHAPAERALGQVTAPTLVVMGTQDPDFPDPAAEAAWIATKLPATIVMVDEAGHYPHAQRPDVVAPAVTEFLAGLDA